MISDWYQNLQRPPFTPPNWVFGPAWAILYAMILLSIILYVRAPKTAPKYVIITTYILLAVHIATNLLWTALFFRLQSPALALVDIVLLDLTLALLIYRFYPTSPTASLLLIPYQLWVLFATYLNVGFWVLNRT